MKPHEKIAHEINESRLLCAACPDCKCRPSLTYDPGCTVVKCGCHKIVMPDFQPKQAMRIWNRCHMAKSYTEWTIEKTIKQLKIDI